MKIRHISKYYHTIKYLTLKQIFFRIFYTFHKPKVHVLAILPQRQWAKVWKAPLVMPPHLSEDGEFNCFHQTGRLDNPNLWNSKDYSKLWLYHLHYCNDLNATSSDEREKQLNQYIAMWMKNNPPCRGNGWEPYPLSLRIVNWIKWFSRYPEAATPERQLNLLMQIDALDQQIEYHILANHLFANAKALIFAGTFFEGQQAQLWLEKGLKILKHEIPEQFLADGGHFELSPMYHAMMLWDMCDLVNLAQRSELSLLFHQPSLQSWKNVIMQGLSWLTAMVHPDGEVAFFNDTTLGVAPTLHHLQNYAATLGIQITSPAPQPLIPQILKESGYCIVPLGAHSKAILDIGPVGPDYQPGHAHADTLSFELSVAGQRLLVNSGISQYGDDQQRFQQRSTTAHNTISIDDQNSSEVWAGFRVAQRAKPQHFSSKTTAKNVVIQCEHDGFLRLPGHNLHRREWLFTPTSVTIHDYLTGRFHQAEARFYFHPAIRVCQVSPEQVDCELPFGGPVRLFFSAHAQASIIPTSWYPGFGEVQTNTCLLIQFTQPQLETYITWDL